MSELKVLDKGIVRLIAKMGSDSSICSSARISHSNKKQKPSASDELLLRYLMRHQIHGPFEQATVNFYVKAPVLVLRQWQNSITQSYNEIAEISEISEISGIYSEISDEFYIPSESTVTTQSTDKQEGVSKALDINLYNNLIKAEQSGVTPDNETVAFSAWAEVFEREQKNIRKQYEQYLSLGMRKDLARQILPVSLYSEMLVTANLRSWFDFLSLSLKEEAQYEIRVYAQALLDILKTIFPLSCKGFVDYTLTSLKLTGPEIEAFKNLLNTEETLNLIKKVDEVADSTFTNKLEKSEFISKVTRILSS